MQVQVAIVQLPHSLLVRPLACVGVWNYTLDTLITTPRARAVKMCQARPDLCDAGYISECLFICQPGVVALNASGWGPAVVSISNLCALHRRRGAG